MFLIGQNRNSPRNNHNFFSRWWTDARRPPIDFRCPVTKSSCRANKSCIYKGFAGGVVLLKPERGCRESCSKCIVFSYSVQCRNCVVSVVSFVFKNVLMSKSLVRLCFSEDCCSGQGPNFEMSSWAARMHRRAATFSNVVTSCGHPSGPYPRRLEKVKFGVPLEEVCKNDIPGPLLVSIILVCLNDRGK